MCEASRSSAEKAGKVNQKGKGCRKRRPHLLIERCVGGKERRVLLSPAPVLVTSSSRAKLSREGEVKSEIKWGDNNHNHLRHFSEARNRGIRGELEGNYFPLSIY